MGIISYYPNQSLLYSFSYILCFAFVPPSLYVYLYSYRINWRYSISQKKHTASYVSSQQAAATPCAGLQEVRGQWQAWLGMSSRKGNTNETETDTIDCPTKRKVKAVIQYGIVILRKWPQLYFLIPAPARSRWISDHYCTVHSCKCVLQSCLFPQCVCPLLPSTSNIINIHAHATLVLCRLPSSCNFSWLLHSSHMYLVRVLDAWLLEAWVNWGREMFENKHLDKPRNNYKELGTAVTSRH